MIIDCIRVAFTTNLIGEPTISKSITDHFSTDKATYIVKSGVLEPVMVAHCVIHDVRKINA